MQRRRHWSDILKDRLTKNSYDDEVVVRVLSPLGLFLGAFTCPLDTLPQLVAINKMIAGGIYFRWDGMKEEECQ